MEPTTVVVLALAFAALAWLYASVGHAGASGYLAAMALVGLSSEQMRPTALALNVVVGTIATIKFYRAGCFNARLFIVFAAASIPMAVVGGRITLDPVVYRPVIGLVLAYASVRLWTLAGRSQPSPSDASDTTPEVREPAVAITLPTGGALGLLAGLTGVGGGIFLSPLLLLSGWAPPRIASGTVAAFVLVNSIAGLVGLHFGAGVALAGPSWAIGAWAGAVAVFGYLGAHYGSRRAGNAMIRRLLAAVLMIAAIKMFLTALSGG